MELTQVQSPEPHAPKHSQEWMNSKNRVESEWTLSTTDVAQKTKVYVDIY